MKMNNKIKAAFDAVHAEDVLKRQTKEFVGAAIERRATKSNVFVRRMATAFACLALMLLGAGGWRLYNTPVSAISVDVNPSIELGINRFDRVVSVEGFNADGIALANTVDLQSMDYADALETLLASDTMRPYLGNDAVVSIVVLGSTDAKSEEMQQRISACRYAANPNVQCQCGNREEIEPAHAAGLSFGKYRAYLELQALDPTISVDDVRDLTMRQIRDRIAQLTGGQQGAQNGSGHGIGSGRGGQHRGGNAGAE